MKTEELRQMDEDELEIKLVEARHELFNLRFQVVTGQLDNTARIPQVRREVARIMTVQREREIAAAEALEAEAEAAARAGEAPAAAEGEAQ
ncbi:MAG TPA: 50S ribosomal protein L29 [Acidimicrobiales bacterium]|nr:50S ribosomal protein L29 [Acidimicrobiales bacterium]